MAEKLAMRLMKFLVFLIILLGQFALAKSAFARQFQISCKFEIDKHKVISELDARERYESYDFSKVEFLVRLDS